MQNNILLSICIPTYNRSLYLEQTILSIISQERFKNFDDIEIVISDNCSIDDTKEVVSKFIDNNNGRIRYFKNDENIKDNNYQKVLSYGKGEFLKLNNDTLLHHNNTLNIIIKEIQDNLNEKKVLFFTNGKEVNKKNIQGIDTFVKSVSFLSTWIACFGIWKEHFNAINDFSKDSDKQLVQTDILFRIISDNKKIKINSSNIFTSIVPENKKLYNYFKIFIIYYLDYLEYYRKKRQISYFTLYNEKSKLFLFWFIPSLLNLPRNQKPYPFTAKEIIKIALKKYKFHPVLYVGIIIFINKILLNLFKKK